jgi:hypothetical protein
VTRAALRMADQRRGRVPTRCAVTGAPTEGAVHAWAVELGRADVLWLAVGPVLRPLSALVRRRSERIVLPLAPEAWASLRAGLRWAVVVAGVGGGALALGLVQGDAGVVVLGAVLLVAAWTIRALVLWRRWVGVVLRPGGEEVALSRVSPGFDAAARALFVGSVVEMRRIAPPARRGWGEHG